MQPIKALIIVEMIGRPKEHLEETLKEYIKKISSEKGITLANEKIHEPKKIEDKKNEKEAAEEKTETKAEAELFSTFAEIEIESKDIATLMKIIFIYLPSHIEITSPENLELKNLDFNDLFNEVIRKMHGYDSIAKSMVMENKLIRKQFQQIIDNIKKPATKVKENLPGEEEKEEVEEVKMQGEADAKPQKQRKKKQLDLA